MKKLLAITMVVVCTLVMVSCSNNPVTPIPTITVSGTITPDMEKQHGVWMINPVPTGTICKVEARNPNPGSLWMAVQYEDARSVGCADGPVYITMTHGDIAMGYEYRITVQVGQN